MCEPVVLLLSGGLDSAANLALSSESPLEKPILALTLNYGQRSFLKEKKAAQDLCHYYQVPHEILDLTWLGRLGGSALTQSEESLPEFEVSELDHPEKTQASAKRVWVPNRNGVFVQVAAAYAERLGAKKVLLGLNREEAVTFPDNSSDFMKAETLALRYSTLAQVEVFSHTVDLTKKEIVAQLRALSHPFPWDFLWSCYEGFENPCGKCESCLRLKRALEA